MDMSSQFWLVRACPKAWRDAHTSLFLWVNKKVVGKRKALDETQEDFTLMSQSWVYGFVRWMRLWKKMGFIPAQPYEVSPFWGSARPLGRWGNVPNSWCSWLVQVDSAFSCPAVNGRADFAWAPFVLWLPAGFGWGIACPVGRSRARSGDYHSSSIHILGWGVSLMWNHMSPALVGWVPYH